MVLKPEDIKPVKQTKVEVRSRNFQGYLIVFAAFSVQFVSDGFSYNLGLMCVELKTFFRFENDNQIVWIGSLLVGMTFCAGPISSSLVSKFGCRKVLILGTLTSGASLILSSHAEKIELLFLTVGLCCGLGFGLIYLPAIVSVTSNFDKYRSRATGIAATGPSLGNFTIAIVLTFLLKTYGWQKTLIIYGCIVLSCSVFGFVFNSSVNDEKEDSMTVKTCDGAKCDLDKSAEVAKKSGKLFLLMSDSSFLVFAVTNFLVSVGYNIPFTFLPLYTNSIKMSSTDTSYLISLIGLANTLGRLIFGFISDSDKVNRLTVYSICLITCGFATTIVGWFDGFWSLATYSVVFGFTTGGFVVLTSVIVVDLIGLEKLSDGFGLVLFFQGFPSFFGQPLGAFLNSCFENYKPAFILAGICIISGGFLLNLIPLMKSLTKKNLPKSSNV